MPAISVIVPAYNAEDTILETVNSIQKQTFSEFELIVINDGSTDRTLELLCRIQDSRLKIFSYENRGVSVARNRGIALAAGDFITFVDADDLWTPDKLELQLAALQQHPEAGVAYSWTCYISEKGTFFHTSEPVYFEGDVYAQLLMRNFLDSGSNALIRRQALESVEFDSALTHGEDWEFYLRLAACWPFAVVPKAQILYRQSLTSASAKIEVMEQDTIKVIERAFQSAPPELQTLKKQSLANLYQFLAHLYLTRIPDAGGTEQAEQKLQTAVRLCPRILLNRRTQVLFIKLLLIRLISPRIASRLLKRVSRTRANIIRENNLVKT